MMNGRDRGSDEDLDADLEKVLQKAKKASTPACVSQRELQRLTPLTAISLDVSPKLTDSMGISNKKGQQRDMEARQQFEAKSLLREWTDYRGNLITSGRMIDLKYDNVVLDVDGSRRFIPVSQLSDVDVSYIADLWNQPNRCGSGYEPLIGRDFVASTTQFKASGACHNPLYFQQVQLERYGHEAGPILQPLISSAHFFLTIPLLPYKMGLNPPNECQYALGYIRPGNCAPYMVQPFPWSTRAALIEAGAIAGGAALIP
jgi:hypothetical protein